MSDREGCHDMGDNWDCNGENDGTGDCNCFGCTGSEACPECGVGDDDHDRPIVVVELPDRLAIDEAVGHA